MHIVEWACKNKSWPGKALIRCIERIDYSNWDTVGWEYLQIISQRTKFSSAFLSIFLGCEDITLPKARCVGDYLDNQRFLFLFMV